MKKFLMNSSSVTALIDSYSVGLGHRDWSSKFDGSSTIVTEDFYCIGPLEIINDVAQSLGLGYDFDCNPRIEIEGHELWVGFGSISQLKPSRDLSFGFNTLYSFDDFGLWENHASGEAQVGVMIDIDEAFVYTKSKRVLAMPAQPMRSGQDPFRDTLSECNFLASGYPGGIPRSSVLKSRQEWK